MANKQVIKYTYLLLTILTRQFSHQPPTEQHFMNTNQRLSTHHLPNGPNPKVNLSSAPNSSPQKRLSPQFSPDKRPPILCPVNKCNKPRNPKARHEHRVNLG